MRVLEEHVKDSPCPLLSLRFIGLKWEAKARRFCCRACCMRRCCSSASCSIFFSGPSAAAPRSILSFRCSKVAACASCCCPKARAMGTRLAMTGVDISSNIRGRVVKLHDSTFKRNGRKPNRPVFFFRLGLAEVFRPLCPVGVFCTEDEERREFGPELGEGQYR